MPGCVAAEGDAEDDVLGWVWEGVGEVGGEVGEEEGGVEGGAIWGCLVVACNGGVGGTHGM